MRTRLLDFIACPTCSGPFTAKAQEEVSGEIIKGSITCPKCDKSYPIIGGILRFFSDYESDADLRAVYADSFGHQWTTYNWVREEDEFEFFQITDLKKEDLAGKTVLDVGCGGGRFARIVAKYCKEYVGLDYSIAVNKARELCSEYNNVHFIQCDANEHPFKNGIFDFVYSHGVLHHTPDTKKTFDKVKGIVKNNGILYVAVFRKAILPLRISDQFWRSIANKLPSPILDKVCGGLSYLVYLPAATFWKRFFWFSLQRTHEIRKCCLYDWYAPRYHHEHDVEEVLEWFKEAGISQPKYINAWPYCPPEIKYKVPTFSDNIRLGLLLGVIGTRTDSCAE